MTEREQHDPPRCTATHPDTGLQCVRVVPPHAGWPHIAGDGSQWDDETTRPDAESLTGRKPVTQMTRADFAAQVALACAERVRQLMAEQRAARCPS